MKHISAQSVDQRATKNEMPVRERGHYCESRDRVDDPRECQKASVQRLGGVVVRAM